MKRINRAVPKHLQLRSVAEAFSQKSIVAISDLEVINQMCSWRWRGLEDAQICPKCGVVAKHAWRKRRAVWRCKICATEFSITNSTRFSTQHVEVTHGKTMIIRVIIER